MTVEQYEREMQQCTCDGDMNWEGTAYKRLPIRGCPVHREEDEDYWAERDAEPHASDCAYWADESCSCMFRRHEL